MGFKKITYSLPALKTLLETQNSCVYCFEKCHRSLTISPANLSNLKNSVNEYLSSKVTTCDPELKGIILCHKNIKIVDSVQLNDDGNYRLDYIADTYIFKPDIGSLLTGVVNKKSSDHLGVLVHSVFNATIPRPRIENECPKAWAGSSVKIGQQVTFEVTKVNFLSRLPYIKGKLIDIDEKYNEDGDSGIGGHESTEEGYTYKNSCENQKGFNENGKKKKKKKRSKLGNGLTSDDIQEKDPSPSTSCSLSERKNSSDLSEIQSLLLNQAIASVNSSVSDSSSKKKKKKSSSLLLSPSASFLGSTEVDNNIESVGKRKRESSVNLDDSLNGQSSFTNSSSIDEYPKVKKKKLSKDTTNETSILDSDSMKIEHAGEIKKKKKKSKDNSYCEKEVTDNNTSDTNVQSTIDNLLCIATDANTSDTNVQSTIDNLLCIATDAIKHKKKKKKSSALRDELSHLDTSSNTTEALLDSDDNKQIHSPLESYRKSNKTNHFNGSAQLDDTNNIPDTALRLFHSPYDIKLLNKAERAEKKKKKKSLISNEENSVLTSESDLSSTDLHREHKKKDKKKKKSITHDMEFLQMENDCIAELLSSVQAKKTDVQSNDSPTKKKKKKSSLGESDIPLLESDVIRFSQMPPPTSTKIKKKKSSLGSFTGE